MFTGFDTENQPGIQVWDYSRIPNNSGQFAITLTNDCAPIQYFRTGGSSSAILLYLPHAPVNGKTIKLVNHRYGSSTQQVTIYFPDISGATGFQQVGLGPGQTYDLCFTTSVSGFGSVNGWQRTGWLMLNQSSTSSAGYYGVAFGDGCNASGPQSMALGGTGHNASGTASVIAGGASNTASGQNSAVIGGSSNTANTNSSSAVVGGNTNNASGINSSIVGGASNTANSSNAIILGGGYGNTRSINTCAVIPGSNSPISVISGTSQTTILTLGRQTTTAATTQLASTSSTPQTNNQLTLPNNSAYYVRGSCIANVTGGGNTKAWSFEAAVKRGVGSGTTTLVGTPIKNIVAADAGTSTWDIAILVDTTSGALGINVYGQDATTIRWVCKLESTEVTF